MPEELVIGPHLLGRHPMPVDPRDYKLEHYLEARTAVAQVLTPEMTLQELHDSFPLTAWHEIYAFWHAFKHLFDAPPGPPTPVPSADGSNVWQIGPISNQSNTPHCEGYTGLDWGNSLPINDNWPNAEGHRIYYLCQPGDVNVPVAQQQGSTSRALCKVLVNQLHRASAYAFTTSTDTMRDYLLLHGPLGIGIPWDNDMFNPDSENYVHTGGGEAGGHALIVAGYVAKGDTVPASMWGSTDFDAPENTFVVPNHWDVTWADKGVCYMTVPTIQELLDRNGDCFAALELPL